MKTKPQLTCTYLFADGHAVQIFEKEDPDAGRVTFAVVTEAFTAATCSFTGRLIIGRHNEALTEVLRTARSIRAQEPSISWGSEATKKAGIPCGYLGITTRHGDLYWHDLPGLISSCYTYQGGPAYAEAFNAEDTHWAMHRISRIIRKPKPQPQLQTVC